ncbi:MAG: 3D domain-containing protein [Minisyncoccia bacterium]
MSDPYIGNHPWLKRALKASLVSFILIFALFSRFSGILVEGSFSTIITKADFPSANNTSPYLSSDSFLLGATPPNPETITKTIIATAYSSTPDQTDDTPFITASGKVVKDGIIASNSLPFGTKIKLPKLFGDKIFTVEDRMHYRFSSDHIDIWMPTRESAQEFGVKETLMEILE